MHDAAEATAAHDDGPRVPRPRVQPQPQPPPPPEPPPPVPPQPPVAPQPTASRYTTTTRAYACAAPVVVVLVGILLVATSPDPSVIVATLQVCGWIIITAIAGFMAFGTCLYCLNRSAAVATEAAGMLMSGAIICGSMVLVSLLMLLALASVFMLQSAIRENVEVGPIGMLNTAVVTPLNNTYHEAEHYLISGVSSLFAYGASLRAAYARGTGSAAPGLFDAQTIAWANSVRAVATELYELGVTNETIVGHLVKKFGAPSPNAPAVWGAEQAALLLEYALRSKPSGA